MKDSGGGENNRTPVILGVYDNLSGDEIRSGATVSIGRWCRHNRLAELAFHGFSFLVRRNGLTFFAHWAYAFKAKNTKKRRNNKWKHTLTPQH